MADLKKILDGVIALSLKTGEFIRQERKTFSLDKMELKGLNDLVSYVDKEAEKMIVAGLEELLPEAGFVTEEGTASHEGEVWNWIIDPLDGTTNFIHGLPIFATSIALTRHGKLVLGVVYEVNKDECFAAIEGEQSTCNGKPISVSSCPDLDKSLMATGFPYYNFDKMPTYLDIINELMRNTHGLRRMGSAAVDLVYTACGRFEGFFEYNLNPWDVAAGALIVQEAGGTVTDFNGGGDYLFGRQIAAGNVTQPQMLRTIQRHWP